MSDWFVSGALVLLATNTVLLALAGIKHSRAIINLTDRIRDLEREGGRYE